MCEVKKWEGRGNNNKFLDAAPSFKLRSSCAAMGRGHFWVGGPSMGWDECWWREEAGPPCKIETCAELLVSLSVLARISIAVCRISKWRGETLGVVTGSRPLYWNQNAGNLTHPEIYGNLWAWSWMQHIPDIFRKLEKNLTGMGSVLWALETPGKDPGRAPILRAVNGDTPRPCNTSDNSICDLR